jgi:RNase P/RNase MRP subunit p29
MVGARFLSRGTRRVRVHMISNSKSLTIEGILVAETKRDLVLLTAKVMEEEETSVSITGQIEIPRENVIFKQVLV